MSFYQWLEYTIMLTVTALAGWYGFTLHIYYNDVMWSLLPYTLATVSGIYALYYSNKAYSKTE